MSRAFFDCDCHTEGIFVDVADEHPVDVFVTLWNFGKKGSEADWWTRVKWCWRIIREGLLFPANQTVMRHQEAKRLGKHLIKVSEVMDTKEKKWKKTMRKRKKK